MTFRHLEIFMDVAETLNMTATAKKFFIAQPSVSQSIIDLERDLNICLFERFGKSLYLTDAGAEFLAYARHIVALVREAESRMAALQEGGSVRIGGSMSVGTTILVPLIKKFSQLFPSAQVFFSVDNTANLEHALLNDKIDLALVEGKMKSPQLESHVIMDDEMLLVCSPSHHFAKKEYVSKEMLESEAFLIREKGSGTRELFESVMAASNVHYPVAGVLNNAEAIKHAVSANLGLSVLSEATIVKEIERGELHSLRIDDVPFNRHFSLFYHRNKFFTPVLNAFIDLCEEI